MVLSDDELEYNYKDFEGFLQKMREDFRYSILVNLIKMDMLDEIT